MATVPEKSSISPISSPPILLEVIVQSIEDARAAAEGGADRLEIVREIRRGGLTPPMPLVRAIKAETRLPLRVMVRENAGYATDAGELRTMRDAAAALSDIGVDGLVLGFARDGQLLFDELREVLRGAPATSATLHRAFDSLTDPLSAIDALVEIPQIDRILTDGLASHGGWARHDGGRAHQGVRGAVLYGRPDRCARLREYSDRARGRLTIVAGSGIDEAMLVDIARTRCVREVHVGRAARGGNQESPVAAARVRRLRDVLDV